MTSWGPPFSSSPCDFNPHEREARDVLFYKSGRGWIHFNPHEREARDFKYSRCPRIFKNFNPHEREARDLAIAMGIYALKILIHTSVKLVTSGRARLLAFLRHFNPHEREARDEIGLFKFVEFFLF